MPLLQGFTGPLYFGCTAAPEKFKLPPILLEY